MERRENVPQNCIELKHFSKDTADFLRLLVRQNVKFMVVGGEAVIFHGYPRVTGDIDIFYHRRTANAVRLHAALREFWGGAVPGIQSAGAFMEDGAIVQFGVPPRRIDLINRIDGVSFEAAWKGRARVRIEGGSESFPVNYIGLNALLMNKKTTGRAKDLADVEYLMAVRAKTRALSQNTSRTRS